ncbi:MAG TPA: lipid-A-disaccharide synthase [Gemmatimonadales bacterium]|nr:lipid-A-disaccharide synthase [Gemmatimonadales bacterium]
MRIFLSAGEPSGDLHGARLVSALRARLPGATLEALGGPAMAAAGAAVRFPLARYTVMGFAEVLARLPRHWRLLRRLDRELAAGRYDLVIPVDYPGFNLRLAEAALRHGVPVLYYIAPKYWASGARRAARLARAVSRLAVILPFEEEFFRTAGAPVSYVGHPLLDRPPPPSREAARAALGVAAGQRVLALFPGSRRQELDRLWEPFRAAAELLRQRGACERVVVATVPGGNYPRAGDCQLRREDSATILAAADAALIKSGTGTLEAALAGVPMVVAYRVHPLSAWLARRMLTVPWISLVNLIAGKPVVEELLQEDVVPERLAAALAPLLEPGNPAAGRQQTGLTLVCERLGGPGASERVAEQAAALLA